MTTILVIGGAGYIGSHMSLLLKEAGHRVVVLDDLSTGYADAVCADDFVQGCCGDSVVLDAVFTKHPIDVVMHFASFIEVGESVKNPAKYYENNVVKTIRLLNAMQKHQVKKFIFSSSAAVFGAPQYSPIDEKHPKLPINPYGKTKWMIEQVLEDYDHAYGMKYIALRYFNAAGAHPEATLGERHEPETHLIPLVLKTALGKRSAITIYGDDYDTHDGTCVRDYIHIVDLCQAHLLAMQYLIENQKSGAFNLGNGEGFSVKQVIDVAKSVTGKEFKVDIGSRRAGDPGVLVADANEAARILAWKPTYSSLSDIVEHAWRYESKDKG
ncbi:MAG: UDP-glucose 4-epimerase GalE [Gammaproteobacteria bacterium]